MRAVSKIDAAGRVVIPKELRDRYRLDPGRAVRIIAMPDGVSIVPEERERRFIRRGPILCIDTGADPAELGEFDVGQMRDEYLNSHTP